ncbi:nickel transport protein [Desulfarculales bacterium]
MPRILFRSERLKALFMSLVAALVLALGLASASLAHKVNIYAYIEGGRVKGEAYFAGGDQAKDYLVEILDAQGKVAATARTGAQGEFSLPLPAGAPGPLKVVLKASMGHQGGYTLDAAEGPGPGLAQAETVRHGSVPTVQMGVNTSIKGDLEERLGRLLDQRLQPLTTQIAKLNAERSVTVHDVMAGLGYILGLLGLTAYLKARR